MNIKETLKYIHSINWRGSKPGLSRTNELCQKLGNPEKSLKFIHVTGTNGKGSTCAMIESILRCAGYKVGLYTSPYIRHFNERICVNGEPISDESLANTTTVVREIADNMEDPPTEFELITAIAFLHFKNEECDIVVLEAGMGGRLDSTNVISEPVLSIITGVALDHMAYLGDTVEKIAFEKAGIIKPNRPVLFSVDKESVAKVITDFANEQQSQAFSPDLQAITINFATLDGTIFDYKDYKNIKISLLGLFQTKNAAMAIEAIEILRQNDMPISNYALYNGLANTRWDARFQLMTVKSPDFDGTEEDLNIDNDSDATGQENSKEKALPKKEPIIIYDGSHNPDGISNALKSIEHYFPGKKVNIFTSTMADKDYQLVAKIISQVTLTAFTVNPSNDRALCASTLAQVYRSNGVNAFAFDSFQSALTSAIEDSKANDVPLIALGSLYMYADFCKALKEIYRN